MNQGVILIWLGMVVGGWLTWAFHHWFDPARFLVVCTVGLVSMVFAVAHSDPK